MRTPHWLAGVVCRVRVTGIEAAWMPRQICLLDAQTASATQVGTAHFLPRLVSDDIDKMMQRRMVNQPCFAPESSRPQLTTHGAVDEGGGGCHGARGRGPPRGPGQDQQVQPPAPTRALNRGGFEDQERERQPTQDTPYAARGIADGFCRKRKRSSTTSQWSWSWPTKRTLFRKYYRYRRGSCKTHFEPCTGTKLGTPSSTSHSRRRRKCSASRRRG
jgi:hypothetical protein